MESLDSSTGDGRKNLVSIGDDAINTQALVEGVRDDACGAISTFEGTTRNSFGGSSKTRLASFVP
jgi:molybdopterin synthase catalytic subunit